jgi:enoyl-CoA hydratase/carnithine racemase
MRLERRQTVFVLGLGDDQNRLDARFLSDLDAALDEVVAAPEPAALVTTGGERFYCNGYDLDWLRSLPIAEQRDFVAAHQRLLARFLRLPVPSVAAIGGHAIGGGALLALAHDLRLMREDRGYFCLPEIDAGIPFRPGMMALLASRLAPDVCRDLVLSGERVGGVAAREARIVDESTTAGRLLPRAIERAEALARKDRCTYGRMKERLWGAVAAALDSA